MGQACARSSNSSINIGQACARSSNSSINIGQAPASPSNSWKGIEWMWQLNPNPRSKSETSTWSHYSDIENLIMEEAYSKGETKAIFDDYYIDFRKMLQISNADSSKQRPVKRMVRKREDKHLREERYVDFLVVRDVRLVVNTVWCHRSLSSFDVVWNSIQSNCHQHNRI